MNCLVFITLRGYTIIMNNCLIKKMILLLNGKEKTLPFFLIDKTCKKFLYLCEKLYTICGLIGKRMSSRMRKFLENSFGTLIGTISMCKKTKKMVVQRVIEYGLPEDYNTMFNLYGGVSGVRKIVKEIPYFRYPQDISFICMAFNLKKEDLECYKRKQLRKQGF